MIFKEESHQMMNDTHWHIDMLLLHAHAMFMFHVMFMSCDQEDYVEKCSRPGAAAIRQVMDIRRSKAWASRATANHAFPLASPIPLHAQIYD